MNNVGGNKSFAAMFSSQNSNDSASNGPSENSSKFFNHSSEFWLTFLVLLVDSAAERKRKRKSRWGGTEKDKTFIPGMPTILPSTLDPAQQEAYLGNVVTSLVSSSFSTQLS